MKGMLYMDSQADPEERKCVLCDRVWALFGIAVGLVFLYMSVDILTGSKLTSMLNRGEVVEGDD